MRTILLISVALLCNSLRGQIPPPEYEMAVEKEQLSISLAKIRAEEKLIEERMEQIDLRLDMLQLSKIGLPEGAKTFHSAIVLGYNEESKQADWVAHTISPRITDGRVGRTNDFRDDPKVEGEAVEADYFLKELQADSSFVYDGFGYDRGHLAPSADFAWSRTALSESYFYSNMSPMDPDFNREDWAEMEAILRGYVWRNEVPLYIVTLPLIAEGHEVVERGVNQLAVPQQFVKVALDAENGQGIAFVMPNRKSENDIADFAVSIDRAEELTGFDFFANWDNGHEKVESSFEIGGWFPESTQEGVEPIYAPTLPEGHINTTQAKRWMGSQKKVHVCGTVVSTRFSGSGNYWFNVDKKFPNTVFSVYIRKKDFIHFDNIHKDYLLNEKVCFHSKVTEMFSLPAMNIVRQEQVKPFQPIKK